MNMTKDGIGWGVTQNITDYNGGTIKNIPIGCVVTITTVWRDSYSAVINANFSGTFAMLNVYSYTSTSSRNGTPYTTVGSSLPLVEIGYRNGVDGYGEEYTELKSAGTFIRLS